MEFILKKEKILLLICAGMLLTGCGETEKTETTEITETIGATETVEKTENEDVSTDADETETAEQSVEEEVSQDDTELTQEAESSSDDNQATVETIIETEIIEEDLSEFHGLGSVLGVQDSIRQDLGVDWKDAYVMLAYAYSNGHSNPGIAFLQNSTADPICIIREGSADSGENAYHVYSYYGTYLYELGVLGGSHIYRNAATKGLLCTYLDEYTRWEYSDFNLIYYGTSEMLEGYAELSFMDISNLKQLDLSVDTIANYVQ